MGKTYSRGAGWEEEGPTRMKVARSLEKLGYIRCMLARDALRALEAEACTGAKTKVRFVSINHKSSPHSLMVIYQGIT